MVGGTRAMYQPIRRSYPDRESWLEGRKDTIGASDIAAVLELSPWVSKVALWEEKTGRREPKDLSQVEAVQRGIREEPIIREQFIKDHPDMMVEHHAFDILLHPDMPYLAATLDGELTYMGEDNPRLGLYAGMQGVLEIKTGSYSSKRYLDVWTGGELPIFYFAQVCQQLLVSGADFAWVQVKLFRTEAYGGRDNSHLPETHETFFLVLRSNPVVQQSFTAIIDGAKDFWQCWQEDTVPWTSLKSSR